MEAAAFKELLSNYELLALDIGTGDGRYAYRLAKANPGWLVVGVEPAWENLIETATRSLKKPSRGGISNCLFLRAAIEDMPEELVGCAQTISVNFPWGSLLNGVVDPQSGVVENISKVAALDSELRVVLNLHVFDIEAERSKLRLPVLSQEYMDTVLMPHYEKYGWQLKECQRQGGDSGISSSWGRQLGRGSGRHSLHWKFGRSS